MWHLKWGSEGNLEARYINFDLSSVCGVHVNVKQNALYTFWAHFGHKWIAPSTNFCQFVVHLLQTENLAALGMISPDPLLLLSASSAAAPTRPVAVPHCPRRRHRPRRPRDGCRGRSWLVLRNGLHYSVFHQVYYSLISILPRLFKCTQLSKNFSLGKRLSDESSLKLIITWTGR